MKVKKIALGNDQGAFIEERLTDGVNVIFSNDNNRGKTLVMQGLMFSMGYEPTFPASFDYKNNFFYSHVEVGGTDFEFLRRNNALSVRYNERVHFFRSITEFKYFFDEHIFPLPKIIKDGRIRTVDFQLFYEMFFIGQDNRRSSGVIARGQFNKADFESMFYSLCGYEPTSVGEFDDPKAIKAEIKKLKSQLANIKRKMKILKAPDLAEIVSKVGNAAIYEKSKKDLDRANKIVAELNKTRARETNRKLKLEGLLSELRSLNLDINVGEISCKECGSKDLIYKSEGFKFEVTNSQVRKQILFSIQKEIEKKEQIILDISEEINFEQSKLNELINTAPPRLGDILLYKEEMESDSSLDAEADIIIRQIESLERDLLNADDRAEGHSQAKAELLKQLLCEMNVAYKTVDPNGNIVFSSLFSKNDAAFSGCEEQEYYFSRLVAMNKLVEHKFPIVIDSFRDGELSTPKEREMLDIYKSLPKQVILTATLKKQEYDDEKYSSNKDVNAIDYSGHEDCQLLDSKYIKSFESLVNRFAGMTIH
ncbi:hypothetical protein [Ferrimonas kyonanensis]|uniref:hypothetical protein n=1 Tax=Ferrimonas kyonanensis TaxID=364763 RepID=UPI0004194F32|nr:hypothetical protein [Ferrimonas kyonanensis]